jgi:hypothetical protein
MRGGQAKQRPALRPALAAYAAAEGVGNRGKTRFCHPATEHNLGRLTLESANDMCDTNLLTERTFLSVTGKEVN